ncbi:hypothetical protein TSUD_131010 [Trifolium subterraneum]|nr:hypothetical protein TSUD_131010 [Trifolium subterraneum]
MLQSRSKWLKEGDANSKYFHSVLAGCRREIAITVIQADGVTVEGVSPIRQAVFTHFASHFKTIRMERPRVDNLQFKRLSQVEGSSLIMPFSEAEVKSAVWDCDSYKSPGPDGSILASLKTFGPCFGVTLCALFLSFIGTTAFVKDRQILDGILIANEVVDEARKSKKELMLFKVDFEKAYDSVDWSYLDDWIKECVSTASASVLVNGSPTDEFPIERGLRQGDPLSPFLFLLAAEGLNVLMEVVVAHNLFKGYNIGERDFVSVSHLQFADDTLLLGVKSWANVRALRAVLVLFETMSGLKVNFNKSVLVGVNIPDSWLGEAASALCCKVEKIPFLYLGLSIGGDPRRLVFWEPVLARLKSRLSGWKSRFLSFGGRLVLLKSVLSSLPVYALSFFKAPSGTVPLKVSIFAWRLLRDRLHTKANLVTRGILSPEVHFCTAGCGEIESAHDLFISCSTFGSLWTLVRSWIPFLFVIILFGLHLQRVDLGHNVPFCNSFGLLAFGLFGHKEITDYSEVQQTTLSSCWIRSSFFHSDG